MRKRVRWTPAELEKFIESAKRHGKNDAQISEELGTKTRSQVAKYANDLYHKACSAPEGSMPHAEFIKDVFKPFGCEKTVHIWQKDEQNKFIEAVRTYGKDWEKICEVVGTHSKSLVQAYARIFLK